MFGSNLIQSIVGGIAAVSVSFLVGMWYGNDFGSSAWKLASAQKQLDSINAALTSLQAEDQAISTREQVEEKARAEEFSKASVQKLPVNKSTADALNKLADGG